MSTLERVRDTALTVLDRLHLIRRDTLREWEAHREAGERDLTVLRARNERDATVLANRPDFYATLNQTAFGRPPYRLRRQHDDRT